jgi:APA family basic amino acid/polyamine antiporter|tara:strand:+ start:6379 stop:7695 length:1317 start_codon:yes stop_codon:yes gene_type:complete
LTRKKALGLWTCLALVVGNMVGTGAYLVPATLGRYGTISLIGWVVTAGGAICLAAAFARMSRIMPAEGGPYAYAREAFGDLPAFLVAWGYWVSVWVGNAAMATGFASYLTPFFPAIEESPAVMASVALGAIWLLTAINVWGLREAAVVQTITTVLKVLPLLVFATIGLFWVDTAKFTPFNSSGESHLSAVAATAILTLWGLMGLESATVPAEEVDDAARTIPIATVWGTAATAIIYVASTVAVMGVLPMSELAGSSAPFADTATRIWGSGAGKVVAAGAALAAFGVLNGWVLMQGQMPLAPSRDGLFPARFSRLNERGTPTFTLLLSSSLCTVLVVANFTRGLVGLFTFAVLLASVTIMLAYILAPLAHIVLIRREPKRWGGPGARLAMVVSAVAAAYSLFAVSGAGTSEIVLGVILFAAGVPLYYWVTRRRDASETG